MASTILQFINVIRDKMAADEVRRSGMSMPVERLRELTEKAFVGREEPDAYHALEQIGCSDIARTDPKLQNIYDYTAIFNGESVAVEVTQFFKELIFIHGKERSLRIVQDDLGSRDINKLKYYIPNTRGMSGFSFYVVHSNALWTKNDSDVFEFVMNRINAAFGENENEQISFLFNNWEPYKSEHVASVLLGMRMGDRLPPPPGISEQLCLFERECARMAVEPKGVSPPWLPPVAIVRCAFPGTTGRVVLDDGYGAIVPPIESTDRFFETARRKMAQMKKAESIHGEKRQRWLLLADNGRTNFRPSEMGTERTLEGQADEVQYWDRIVFYDSYISDSWKVDQQ